MKKTYLKMESIDAYNTAFNLSNIVWDMVVKWDSFSKFTLGKQLVESTDSISANVAEGFGRYNKKDKIRFYRYSNGSLFESIDWIKKAKSRKLITNEDFEYITSFQEKLPLELNQLIKYTDIKLKY